MDPGACSTVVPWMSSCKHTVCAGGAWLGVDISVHVCEDTRKRVTSTGCKTDFGAPWSDRACRLMFSALTFVLICLWNEFCT